MDAKSRPRALLGVLAVLLGVLVYVRWPSSSLAPSPAGSGPSRRSTPTRGAAPPASATDVNIEALQSTKVEPNAERNLFKFKPKYVAPPPAPKTMSASTPAIALPPPPPAPPSIPPIALRFIGLIESPGAPRLAILSDGRGAPIYGKEGEVVLGQYRVVRIGAESIEMEYIDGRGRQAIRLSGS